MLRPGSPITLSTNTSYYLLSSEIAGGDQWYDFANTLNRTSVAHIDSARFRQLDGSNAPVYQHEPGDGYTLVTFRYSSSPAVDLAQGEPAMASSQWDATQSPDKAFDGDPTSDWQGSSSIPFGSQWLQVNLGQVMTVDQVTIDEYPDDRTTGFTVDYYDGTAWHTVYTGTTIGTDATINFDPVSASWMKITFTSGSYTPIIFGMQVRDV